MKCESCIWVNKVNEMTWVCPFVKFVITQGFKVDEELEKKPFRNT